MRHPWLDVRLLEEAFRLGLLRVRQLGVGGSIRTSGFESQMFFLVVRALASHVASPSLSFFFFKMGLIMKVSVRVIYIKA